MQVTEIDDLIISYKGKHGISTVECHAELPDGNLVLIAYLGLGKTMTESEIDNIYEEIYNRCLEIARQQGYRLTGDLETEN